MIRILVIGSLRSPPKGETAEWYMKYMTLCFFFPYFSFPLEGKSREAGKGVGGRVPIGCSIAILTANRRTVSFLLLTLGHTFGVRVDGAAPRVVAACRRRAVHRFRSGDESHSRAEPGPPRAEPNGGLNLLNPGHRVAHGEAAPFRLAALATHPLNGGGQVTGRRKTHSLKSAAKPPPPLAPKARQT